MNESNGAGMKTLPAAVECRLFRPINRVTRHRVAEVGHMDPDLMGASGLQSAGNIGKSRELLQHLHMGDGRFGVLLGDAHFFSVVGASSDRGIYCKGTFL